MVFTKLLRPCLTHVNRTTRFLAQHGSQQLTHQVKRNIHATPAILEVKSDLVSSIEQAMERCKVLPPGDLPSFLVEFKEKSSFKIRDMPGQTNVTMSRAFGNEKIKIDFSIDDIQLAQVTKNPKTQVREVASFPVECLITITKGEENGCLMFKTMIEDGDLFIEHVFYHPEADISKKHELVGFKGYLGPDINVLDDDLKRIIYQFLEERDVDEVINLFIPNYIEYKDQKEYHKWLKNLKAFIEE
ncbi:Mitochondrial acidic protein mam33 [Basidiobolus ranarum]|uniref:Mitochondrial acidic protein mam33 n=1 Tax=Basidiobolus ranarum TaxID=34480 RepID=A0ABR2WWP8_9FUNG